MVDRRVRRRGVLFTPKETQVAEARATVRAGLPIHPRWLPFLPPKLRLVAKLREPILQ